MMSDYLAQRRERQLALGYKYVNGILTSPSVLARQAQQDFVVELSQSRRRRPVGQPQFCKMDTFCKMDQFRKMDQFSKMDQFYNLPLWVHPS